MVTLHMKPSLGKCINLFLLKSKQKLFKHKNSRIAIFMGPRSEVKA